jgi:HK97 family phage portal protein
MRIGALFEHSADVPSYSSYIGLNDESGAIVNRSTAAGLPAVADAFRIISETVGMTPMIVYDDDDPEDAQARARARTSWQWELLHNRPNPEQSAFDFWQDVSTSVESTGNAYIWKVRVDLDRLEALFVLDPSYVYVKRQKGRKVFLIAMPGQERRTVGPEQILHIRGWSLAAGADYGVSPITLHRAALGEAISQQQYGSRFYMNNATPPFAITVPDDMDDGDAEKMQDYFVARHSGRNAHKPAILFNGATAAPLGISMEDAQFIESRRWSIEEIARMCRLSPQMLIVATGGGSVTAQDFERFLKLDLAPRLRRIEMACRNDEDLFPEPSERFPEFLADAVLRPDIKTRYEAYRLGRQGGWLKPNEVREKENLPPAEGGDEIQETPVGGAPNTNTDRVDVVE